MPNQPPHLTAARLRIGTIPHGCGEAAAGTLPEVGRLGTPLVGTAGCAVPVPLVIKSLSQAAI